MKQGERKILADVRMFISYFPEQVQSEQGAFCYVALPGISLKSVGVPVAPNFVVFFVVQNGI
jgi:hypothetical protein